MLNSLEESCHSDFIDKDFERCFDDFWEQSIAQTRAYPLEYSITEQEFRLPFFRCYDVSFSGYMGQPIRGWLILPRGQNHVPALIVEFLGYGNGRGLPFERLLWPNFGFAYFVMDTRGQGCGWPGGTGLAGHTPDFETDIEEIPNNLEPPSLNQVTGSFPGFLTKGIHSPYHYYYRRLFCDGFRALEWLEMYKDSSQLGAQSSRFFTIDKVFLLGHSQGGALALAVGALAQRFLTKVDGILANLPFLCDIRNSVSQVQTPPYTEIQSYLRVHVEKEEQIFKTLAYFDMIHFVKRNTAPVIFAAAKQDLVCPLAAIEQAYQLYAGKQKELVTYPWHGHEGGAAHFIQKQRIFLEKVLQQNKTEE